MKITLKFAIVFLFLSTASQASDRKFGLGAIFGEPTGITAKYFAKETFAIDGGLAYSFFESFIFYGDGLWHFPRVFQSSVPEITPLTPYLGIGAGLRVMSKSNPNDGDPRVTLFLRFPFGLEWKFQKVPLGVFVDLVPGMGVAPKIFGLFQGGLGLRYYF